MLLKRLQVDAQALLDFALSESKEPVVNVEWFPSVPLLPPLHGLVRDGKSFLQKARGNQVMDVGGIQ